MNYEHFIADYQLIHDFVSANVKLSGRFIYLNALKGGADFLLEIAEQNPTAQDWERKNSTKVFGDCVEDASAHEVQRERLASSWSKRSSSKKRNSQSQAEGDQALS